MQKKQEILTRRGLTLSRQVLSRLRSVGIVVQSSISLEHQQSAGRYVLRGIESGGAVKDFGRYVTFCGPDGEALAYLHPIDGMAFNGVHAVVVAPVLVRVELFRSGRTCQLLITRHMPSSSENYRRPWVENSVLFRGINGFMDASPVGKNESTALQGPRFWTRSGEELPLPSLWTAAVLAAARGVNCVGCSHAHFLVRPSALAMVASGD